MKNLLIICLLLIAGVSIGYGLMNYAHSTSSAPAKTIRQVASTVGVAEHRVIGFLPYWLLSKADNEYSRYITTLTYFGLTIQPDGTIQKFTKPGEAEPGWHALQNGKVDPFLHKAKANATSLSLLVFNANDETIAELLSDPITHARTLVSEVAPVMKDYGFTDLNLDIESFKDASEGARLSYVEFIKEVHTQVERQNLGTITIDASPTDLIRPRLINLKAVEPFVDHIVLMTYDFHYVGSAVTGAVAPAGGAGIDAEYDVETGIQKALDILPAKKVILGIPLYGYKWETITDDPKSAAMPGSGVTVSNRTQEEFLKTCASCSAAFDPVSKETYLIYKDEDTGMYHQAFYPDGRSTEEKAKLATTYKLGGLALWALGYEGDTILSPLEPYIRSLE